MGFLGACGEVGDGLPDQSYTFPTAIIGVPLQSHDQAVQVKSTLSTFAKRQGLHRYRPIEQPFFAKKNAEDPTSHLERETYYDPPNPRMREGFSLQLLEFSDQCMLVSIFENSGIWTTQSLSAVDELNQALADITQGRSTLLVRPKPEQNWPQQNGFRDPERPAYLASLCVRMGVPDPRSADEAAAQVSVE
jgi:hypothetical protein